MVKLLRSNLSRLIKFKPFYAALAIQAGVMLFITLNSYLQSLKYGSELWADMVFSFTVCSILSAALLAVICSLFIGADYHNGTIRNKLISGLPRYKIYFANLITVMVIAECMNVAAMLVFYPLTLPLFGGFIEKTNMLLTTFFLGNLTLLVYASLYTAVAMTTKNTVAALIVTVASLFIMTMAAQYFLSEINAPLTYTQIVVNEFGEQVQETIPNPYRKSESVLAFFEVLLNIFPSGQVAVLGSDKIVAWQAAVSSLCLIGFSGGIGLAVFSKENLK